MRAWVLSAAPGGNLTIAAASASAVMGSSGRITAQGEAAAAGQWHLGAVSPSGPTGVMGLTLIEVVNR
jgi:hypothetical protein